MRERQPQQKCPCCDDISFSDDRGTLYVCQNCCWQYDSKDLEKPDAESVANGISLTEACRNYLQFGVFDGNCASDNTPMSNNHLLELIEQDMRSEKEPSLASLKKLFRRLEIRFSGADLVTMAHRSRLTELLWKRAYHLYQGGGGAEARQFMENARALSLQAFMDIRPANLEDELLRLKQRDLTGLEGILRFLESDLWYHGSGYIKADLLTALCKVHLKLPADSVPRLQQIVLNTVRSHDRREFRHYCRLARHIDDSDFRTQLEQLRQDPDEGVRRRARWIFEYLQLPRAK